MPTDKPRFSIVVTDELYEKINDFRFNQRIKSQSKAVNELIKIGLHSILNEGFEISPNFTKQELSIIEKYALLDSHGKDMVETVLKKEYDRCVASHDPNLKDAKKIAEEAVKNKRALSGA